MSNSSERRFHHAEATSSSEGSRQDGNPTWHRLLLAGGTTGDEPSGPESLLSNATTLVEETEDEEEEDEGDYILNILRNENSTNYDSGNFSFSESSKGKTAISPESGLEGGTAELHQRFVQLNTELYQAKTELLTYKYKWNEIRNEVELQWSKKYQRAEDEKMALQQEVEDLKEQLDGVVSTGSRTDGSLEVLKLRSEIDQLRIQLDCKDRANTILKDKITEQYCDKENLSLQMKKLEKVLLEMQNDLSSVKSSESWFRNELHTCQNANAKLKESNLLLDNKVSLEKANCDRLKVELQQVIRNAEEVERRAIADKQSLLDRLKLIEASNRMEKVSDLILQEHATKLKEASDKGALLQESNKSLQTEIDQLRNNVELLKNTLHNQESLIQSYKNKETESLVKISTLESEITQLKAFVANAQQETSNLQTTLARQSFTKRDLDVSIGHLQAQLKVLSINFENTRRQLGVKEFALENLRREHQQLRKQHSQELERCRSELDARMRMGESLAAERYEQLLDNFRKIQSKNLDLELKLGQWVEQNEKFRKSEELVHKLRQEIEELQEKIVQDAKVGQDAEERTPSDSSSSSGGSASEDNGAKNSSNTCPKHGNVLPEDDTRELKILLKVIEAENRQKLKRYELNNRTLLKKVKEYDRSRKIAEQQVEALQKDVSKMASMQCELAGMREKSILLEVDLETVSKECDQLKSEKARLITALDNNCRLRCDEDIWTSFQRIFADLRDHQVVQRENKRLKEQLRITEKKISQLEEELKQSLSSSEEKSTVIENLKLTNELQRVESDEIRSELTVKSIQLEDSQRLVTDLSSERSSLQDSLSGQQMNDAKLREEIDFLLKQLQVKDVQLETAYERVKLYEESERILVDSRQRFFNDIQILRDEIIAEKQEKQDLQDLVRALKDSMAQMVESNFKNYQTESQPDSANNTAACGSLTSDGTHSESSNDAAIKPVYDENALKALLEDCSRRNNSSIRPLQDCVASLRMEMNNLNAVVRQNGQQRYHVVSLMEELQDATNGTYNSR